MKLSELRAYIDRLAEAAGEDATVHVNRHRHLVVDTADNSKFGIYTFGDDAATDAATLRAQMIPRRCGTAGTGR
jgi:hypothetical protein